MNLRPLFRIFLLTCLDLLLGLALRLFLLRVLRLLLRIFFRNLLFGIIFRFFLRRLFRLLLWPLLFTCLSILFDFRVFRFFFWMNLRPLFRIFLLTCLDLLFGLWLRLFARGTFWMCFFLCVSFFGLFFSLCRFGRFPFHLWLIQRSCSFGIKNLEVGNIFAEQFVFFRSFVQNQIHTDVVQVLLQRPLFTQPILLQLSRVERISRKRPSQHRKHTPLALLLN